MSEFETKEYEPGNEHSLYRLVDVDHGRDKPFSYPQPPC